MNKGKDATQDRSGQAAKVPNVGQANTAPIEVMDLALHGDAINHWQDEPEASKAEHAAAGKPKTSRRRKRDAHKKTAS
jgi:hypothetical protein